MPRVIAEAQPYVRALLRSWHLREVRSRCPGPAVNPSLEDCGSGPCPRKGGFSHPAGSQRPCWCCRLKCLWNPAGRLCRPFACKASSHKPSFLEWFGRFWDPWRCRCKVSGAMVVPGGSCLARDGQTNSGQGWLERSRKAPPLHRVSDTEHRTSKEPTPGERRKKKPAGSRLEE